MAPPRTPSGVRAGAERGSATGKLELERSRNRGSTGFSEGGHGRAPRDRNGTADIEVLISWSILKERRWYGIVTGKGVRGPPAPHREFELVRTGGPRPVILSWRGRGTGGPRVFVRGATVGHSVTVTERPISKTYFDGYF